MKRFLLRIATVFIAPLLPLVLFYLWTDPFKVVHHYDNYYPDDGVAMAPLNEGWVSVATFDNYQDTKHYNSFILGNSRTRVYHVEEWQKYLGEGSRGFHFYALSESLYGLCLKVQYLDGQGTDIRNALLVMDENLLAKDKCLKGQLFQTPPQLEQYKNLTAFHFDAFRAYCDIDFLMCWVKYKTTGTVSGCLYVDKGYNLEYNEGNLVDSESRIKDGTFYTDALVKSFTDVCQSPDIPTGPVIKARQIEYLNDIHEIFLKHNTNVRVVISPLWDQRPLNAADLEILKTIFGPENVFDFSGKNKFTVDWHDWYEPLHYRPTVALEIMSTIYR